MSDTVEAHAANCRMTKDSNPKVTLRASTTWLDSEKSTLEVHPRFWDKLLANRMKDKLLAK